MSGLPPWFLPGVAASLVVSLAVSGSISRLLCVRRTVGWGLVMALGIIVSATLTPRGDAVPVASCDLTMLGPASLARLLTVNETSLNLLLFIPLGTVLGLLPRSRRKVVIVAAAIVLPFAIEAIQLIAPYLSRACQAADIANNLTALAFGLVLGTAGGRLIRTRAPGRDPDPAAGLR